MGEIRNEDTKPFPVSGETVLAEDGTTWTWHAVGDTSTEHGGEWGTGGWEQGSPAYSRHELDQLDARDHANLSELSTAHKVYALAFGAVRVVKREDLLTEHEPPDAYVHALAHSALIDAILNVAAPQPVGKPPTHAQEDGTRTRLRALLGDPEMATAQAKLEDLRRQMRDEQTPDAVSVKTRTARMTLGSLAAALPLDSDPRKTIQELVSAKAQPSMALADRLFREMMAEVTTPKQAWEAYTAASTFIASFA
jgi:hypothetical protein